MDSARGSGDDAGPIPFPPPGDPAPMREPRRRAARADALRRHAPGRALPPLLAALALAACSDGTSVAAGSADRPGAGASDAAPVAAPVPSPNDPPAPIGEAPDPLAGPEPSAGGTGTATAEAPEATARPPVDDPVPGPGSVFGPVSPAVAESAAHYAADGYDTLDVLRVDVATRAEGGGPCLEGDDGCTFADVLADVDGSDDLTVEIPVLVTADDLDGGGLDPNAEIRQRGNTTRAAPQKSFRVRLDDEAGLWRGEQRLQLNKHPYDRSRMRNKLAFDLMQRVPHLPSLRTQFVHLYVDDGAGPVDRGLYTHVEAVVKEYLVNRGRDRDERLYKAERFQFLPSQLDALALDAEGEPVDEDAFETVLEIKRGDDHRTLFAAATAVADPDAAFEDTMARHFDEGNALAWLAVNVLIGQHDVGSHNYYLHVPLGSDTLHFLPWDYDSAFRTEPELVDSFDAEALEDRLRHGFARLHDNRFTRRWLERPGAYGRLVAAADELRAGPLSDDAVASLVAAYAPLVRPIVARAPDVGFLPGVRAPENMDAWDAEVAGLVDTVGANHRALSDGPHVPLPPFLKRPYRDGDEVVLWWEPAFAVSGGELVYALEVASSPDFAPGTVALDVDGITDPDGRVEYRTSARTLPPGRWYYRAVARVEGADPAYWQTANNTLEEGGVRYVGVRAFELD